MIDLVFKNTTTHKLIPLAFLKEVFSSCAESLKMANKQIELSLNFIDSEEMRRLNKQYRRKDKVTDVLSFPLDDDKLSKYGIIPLGDIFVCPDFVKKDSEDRGIDFREELIRVCIHGFLHLAGYDHELSQEDEKIMIDMQEKILEELV